MAPTISEAPLETLATQGKNGCMKYLLITLPLALLSCGPGIPDTAGAPVKAPETPKQVNKAEETPKKIDVVEQLFPTKLGEPLDPATVFLRGRYLCEKVVVKQGLGLSEEALTLHQRSTAMVTKGRDRNSFGTQDLWFKDSLVLLDGDREFDPTGRRSTGMSAGAYCTVKFVSNSAIQLLPEAGYNSGIRIPETLIVLKTASLSGPIQPISEIKTPSDVKWESKLSIVLELHYRLVNPPQGETEKLEVFDIMNP